MSGEPDLAAILETVDDILSTEATRKTALQAELEDFETDSDAVFTRTRSIIEEERELLERLHELLVAEAAHIDDLEDATGYLDVEQAVRNRNDAVTKLERHNQHLQAFHDHLLDALAAVETNLDELEDSGESRLPADAEPYIADARAAIDDHNEAVAGLGRNLRILHAYLR